MTHLRQKGDKNLLNDLVSSGIWNLTTFKLKFEPNLQTFSSQNLNLFRLWKIEQLRTEFLQRCYLYWKGSGDDYDLYSGIINIFKASRKPKIVGVGRGWLFLLQLSGDVSIINYLCIPTTSDEPSLPPPSDWSCSRESNWQGQVSQRPGVTGWWG